MKRFSGVMSRIRTARTRQDGPIGRGRRPWASLLEVEVTFGSGRFQRLSLRDGDRVRADRSSRRAPDARGAIGAGGGDALAVREEGHTGHATSMTFVGVQRLATLDVPNTHGFVKQAAGDDTLAV